MIFHLEFSLQDGVAFLSFPLFEIFYEEIVLFIMIALTVRGDTGGCVAAV